MFAFCVTLYMLLSIYLPIFLISEQIEMHSVYRKVDQLFRKKNIDCDKKTKYEIAKLLIYFTGFIYMTTLIILHIYVVLETDFYLNITFFNTTITFQTTGALYIICLLAHILCLANIFLKFKSYINKYSLKGKEYVYRKNK